MTPLNCAATSLTCSKVGRDAVAVADHPAGRRSGVAVRFPRIARWRQDKKVEDADSIETLRELIRARQG